MNRDSVIIICEICAWIVPTQIMRKPLLQLRFERCQMSEEPKTDSRCGGNVR